MSKQAVCGKSSIKILHPISKEATDHLVSMFPSAYANEFHQFNGCIFVGWRIPYKLVLFAGNGNLKIKTQRLCVLASYSVIFHLHCEEPDDVWPRCQVIKLASSKVSNYVIML